MASTPASSSTSTLHENPVSWQISSYEALDSALTLLDPPPPRTFIFSHSSVLNATLYSSARPIYEVKSANVSRTDLFDLNEQRVVASIKRRQIFSDVVVFAHRNNTPIRIKKWLKRHKVPYGQTPCAPHYLETLAGRFTWRSEIVGSRRFVLYFEGQDDSPVAYSKSMCDPPTIVLLLTPGLENVLVEIITSFLVLESRLRMDEKMEYRVGINTALIGFI